MSNVWLTHAATNFVQYELDTYDGSSGAPVLYFGDSDGVVIVGVHLGHGKGHVYNEGSVLTKAVLKEMMDAFRE